MPHRLLKACLTVVVTAAAAVALAAPGDGIGLGKPQMFGKSHPFGVADLPAGRLRARLESLPWAARERALDWLHRFEFPEADLDSLRLDDEGAAYYVEAALVSCTEAGCPETAQGPTGDEPAIGAGPTAVEDAFALHSRPGAPNVVYLDFDGHSFSNTAWGSGTFNGKPFDLDGSPSTFNDAERAAIAEIWHRVAEDFAPYDIDVTTEEPRSFGPTTGRVLITSKTDANGRAMPSNGGGGVAYIGVWGGSSYATKYSPALVYYDNLAKNTVYIAESCAHEFGHNLGLSHDGSSGSTYYSGHGSGGISWAPIMGNAFSKNVTQWSRGEYSGANNTQDDVAVITQALGLAGDDHGDSRNSATPLLIEASGEILVSNPETDPYNGYPDNKGVIDSADDWDYFSFSAAAGPVDITVNPASEAFYRTSKRGVNLDIQARLLSANGQTLASSDPATETYANIATSVSGGTYYLAITGVGSANYSDYASHGQYFISGTVTTDSAPNTPPNAAFGYGCQDLSCSFSDGSSDSDGSIVGWAWSFGDGSTSSARSPSHTYAAGGSYTVTLTVTDDDGDTDSATQSVSVAAPNQPPSADFGYSCSGLSCSFSDGSSDSDGAILARSWSFGDGNSSTTTNPGHSYAGAGSYTVTLTVTDDDGASASASTTVTVAVPNVAPAAGFEYACTGLDCSFTDTSTDSDGAIVARSWSFGDGSTSTAANPGHSFAAAGSYTVSLTVTDDDGASASASTTVSVSVPNTPPSAAFSYACSGLNCSFTDASSDSDGGIAGWAWDFGDGTTSTAQSPSHGFAAQGSYTVVLAVTDDDGAVTTVGKTVVVTDGGAGGEGNVQPAMVVRRSDTGFVYLWEQAAGQMTVHGIKTRPLNQQIVGLGDFTGDGQTDILWRNTDTGYLYLWEMQGSAFTWHGIKSRPLNHQIAGVGDVTGDGKADILWRNVDTGYVYLWEMHGSEYTWHGLGSRPLDHEVLGLGDLSGDGKADVLWRKTDTGYLYFWEMNGGQFTWRGLKSRPLDHEVVGLGDLSGDGKADILWRSAATGYLYFWEMNGGEFTWHGLKSRPLEHEVLGLGDLSGDGKADILWRNTDTGYAYFWEMNGDQSTYHGLGALPLNRDLVGIGEFGVLP